MSRAGTVAVAIVIVVAVVAAGWAVLFLRDSPGDLVRGDLAVSSGLNRSDVEVDEYAGVATLVYTGEGDAAWTMLDEDEPCYVLEDDGTYAERTGDVVATGSVLTFSDPGCYTVELLVDGSVLCTGTAVLDGTVERLYSWSETVDGRTYSYEVVFRYQYSDYYRYASDTDAVRWSSDDLDPTRFAVVDEPLSELSALLLDEYERVRGSPTAQSYADYVLGFVQCCIEYPDALVEEDGVLRYSSDGNGDIYLYGTEEYWAYPMETIQRGMGDCEDTSFLAAALFTASGYTAGVATIPGHMVALVLLDEFAPHRLSVNVALSTTLSSADLSEGGVVFFCETTFDTAVPCGYVTHSVGIYLSMIDHVWIVDR